MSVLSRAYGLRLKFSLGLGLLLSLLVFSSLLQWQALQLTERNHQVLGQLQQLPTLRNLLLRRSHAYQQNAPRDFDSYNRDLQIFQQGLRTDLHSYGQQLDTQLAAVTQRQALTLPESFLRLAGAGAGLAQLQQATERLTQAWHGYRAGLREALGRNTNEPRLEWGARFITEQAPPLAQDETAFIEAYRQVLNNEKHLLVQLMTVLLSLCGLLLSLGSIWFYRSVIRGIVRTASAFNRVANGDFGHQIQNPRHDELGLLVEAFNRVSGRTRFVLTLLQDLNRASHPKEAVDLLFELLQAPLTLSWLGVMSADRDGQLRLLACAPTSLKQNFPLEADKPGLGRQLLQHENGWLRIDRLAEHVLHYPQDRLLREVIRVRGGEVLLALRLTGWQSALVLVLKQPEADPELLNLLQSLARPIALRFQELESSQPEALPGRVAFA